MSIDMFPHPTAPPSLSFVGGGHMARALIQGLIARGMAPAACKVIDPNAAVRSALHDQFGVVSFESASASALDGTVIILAVKPQHMRTAVAAIAPWVNNQLVISVAAGVRARDIARWLNGHPRIVRAMPNTPAQIGWGASGIAALHPDNEADLSLAEGLLGAVGITVRVPDESLLDAVTALSGSGPAYVLYVLETLISGGTALGLTPDAAQHLALQTVLGAAHLAQMTNKTPARLREQVTSKGGTTAAALQVMTQQGMNTILHDAMAAAARRARELADEFGADHQPD